MKNLKKLLIGAMTITALSLGFTSCTDDPCDDVTCLNEGICNEGICDCVAGYGGSSCGTKFADQFVGKWDCRDVDTATNTPYVYTADITVSSNSPTIINIDNFGAFSDVLSVTQNTTTTSNFYLTGPVDQNGVDISNVDGNINATGDTLNVTYTAADAGRVSQNVGVWVLQ